MTYAPDGCPVPPPEPFVRPDKWWGRNAFWAHTNPTLLVVEGVLVMIGGPVFAAYLASVVRANGDAPDWIYLFFIGFGFCLLGCGVALLYCGIVRGRWEKEYERVMGHKPRHT